MSKDEETILPYRESISSTPAQPTVQQKSNIVRNEITVFIGEFIGTFMFLFLAFAGTQIAIESAKISPSAPGDTNPPPDVSKLLYIAFSFGISLAVNVSIFADVSGGMFNPAVTVALTAVRLIPWTRALHSIFAQLLASICAAFVVSAILPGPFSVATKLDPTMSITRGLFLEMFMTTQLILTILFFPTCSAKPMYIGSTLFIAEICSVYLTGGSLNPARSFGPAVATAFDGYHWIYWLGPILGAGIASGVFILVKQLQKSES